MSVTAWVLGHQLIDLVGLMLHPILFFAWMYVLTLTPVPAWSYFTTLAVVGIYTSGLGYLVSAPCRTMPELVGGDCPCSVEGRELGASSACCQCHVRAWRPALCTLASSPQIKLSHCCRASADMHCSVFRALFCTRTVRPLVSA